MEESLLDTQPLVDPIIQDFKDLYESSSERPFNVTSEWLDYLTFRELNNMIDNGMDLKCDAATDYIENPNYIYHELDQVIKLVQPSDRIYTLPYDIDHDTMMKIAKLGLRVKLDGIRCVQDTPDNSEEFVNYFINLAKNLKQFNIKPTMDWRNFKYVVMLHFLGVNVTAVPSTELQPNERIMNIFGHDLLVMYDVEDMDKYLESISELTCQKVLEGMKNEFNSMNIVDSHPLMRSVYDTVFGDTVHKNISYSLIRATTILDKNLNVDKEFIDFLVDVVLCRCKTALFLLFMLHDRKVIKINDYRGRNVLLDRLLEFRNSIIGN
jgi:hypothetical protein